MQANIHEVLTDPNRAKKVAEAREAQVNQQNAISAVEGKWRCWRAQSDTQEYINIVTNGCAEHIKNTMRLSQNPEISDQEIRLRLVHLSGVQDMLIILNNLAGQS